ncbi:hypothetical protein [uncultured Shewanella sp.]|uniref:hypothetical protein n=1 Tax=uncultured Shewanella sp. TaxID=173975 RepID=UPI00260564E4|nr:hypothetical protein [uncultured Shewanella sp.]
MARTSYNCDIAQGFNFQKDEQTLVGHINTLSIAGKEFKPDIAVMDPTKINESGSKKVVGIVSNIDWEGGFANPISFGCQISIDNKQAATLLQHSNLSNTSVSVGFSIYEYDPKAKVYYMNFHTETAPLLGLVNKSGGELNLHIDNDFSTTIVSPKNFYFCLGVMPEDQEQDIHMAVSNTSKFAKKWGVTVKA